jgi:DNA ligase-1
MRSLLLAKTWTPKIDPTGWWMSAKLDGIRAYWDGKGTLWSRLGKPFTKAPAEFLARLPKSAPLDGELYLGPGRFNDTVRAVKGSAGWSELRYVVFDAPADYDDSAVPFEARMHLARLCWHDVVQNVRCRDLDHLMATLREFEAQGLEGIMLRKPRSIYEGKRSSTLLKVKTFKDCEATVTGYTRGRGKHVGKVGALVCMLDSGHWVAVGTGLTDAERETPPAIGARITIRYFELTPAGVPRFPTFVAVRDYE